MDGWQLKRDLPRRCAIGEDLRIRSTSVHVIRLEKQFEVGKRAVVLFDLRQKSKDESPHRFKDVGFRVSYN